jgi:hypothetical protein
LTNDALDPQALIPEFKACGVQVFPAREEELANPEVEVLVFATRVVLNVEEIIKTRSY